jgi:hypothetical protein
MIGPGGCVAGEAGDGLAQQAAYSLMVRTTSDVGRWLTVGSF